MSVEMLETKAARYELQIPIEAGREDVWRALVEETNAWWLPDFHMVGEGSVVTLDARAGGQLIETREDGGGLLWYTVEKCTPGEELQMVGHLGAAWGGPTTTMLSLVLGEQGEGTLLVLTDAQHGHVSEKNVESLRAGWQQLMSDGLKAHVEAK